MMCALPERGQINPDEYWRSDTKKEVEEEKEPLADHRDNYI